MGAEKNLYGPLRAVRTPAQGRDDWRLLVVGGQLDGHVIAVEPCLFSQDGFRGELWAGRILLARSRAGDQRQILATLAACLGRPKLTAAIAALDLSQHAVECDMDEDCRCGALPTPAPSVEELEDEYMGRLHEAEVKP